MCCKNHPSEGKFREVDVSPVPPAGILQSFGLQKQQSCFISHFPVGGFCFGIGIGRVKAENIFPESAFAHQAFCFTEPETIDAEIQCGNAFGFEK